MDEEYTMDTTKEVELKWYFVKLTEPFRNDQFVYLETVNYKK